MDSPSSIINAPDGPLRGERETCDRPGDSIPACLSFFDIDLTLLRSYGVGVGSMQAACRELFDREISFEGIEIAGRLDSLIWADVAQRNGIENTEAMQ